MNGNEENRDDELPSEDDIESAEDGGGGETEDSDEEPVPGTGTRMPRHPATRDERLTIKKILERVGGAGTGRVRLYVKRIDNSGICYKLPPLHVDHQLTDLGMEPAELIGETYGNGHYKWEIRLSGRYVHGDKDRVSNYPDVNPSEDAPKPDMNSLIGQLKADLLNELRPKDVPPPPVDIAGAVRSALEPMIRLLEVRTLEVAARRPSKEADPATAAILGILSQQNQTLLGLVSKALETPKFRPEPAPAPIPNPAPVAPVADSLKSRVSDLKELLSLSREIGGSAYPQVVAYDAAAGGDDGDGDGGDDDDDDSDDDSGDSFEGMENPAETGNPVVDFISRIKTHFLGTADRMTKEVLQVSEEKMKTGLLAGLSKPVEQGSTDRADTAPITAPKPQVPAAAPSVPQSQSAATFVESLVGSIEQCVREKRPVQEFLTLITTGAPEGFVSTVKQLTVDQIVAFGSTIERPDLTERFSQPEVHKYLAEALSALKGGDAK